jgi:hypothetical protein
MAPCIVADLAAAIALVPYDALRSQLGASASSSLDSPALHEGLKDGGLVLLSRSENDAHQLAAPFSTNVDLGAESALASA